MQAGQFLNPKIVKHLLFPLQERLLGRNPPFFLKELEHLQWISRDQIQALQLRKLRELLLHARDNIPFYRTRLAEAGFDPNAMQRVEDFKVLPLLTKAEIRENLESMLWNASPGGLYRYNTGGSSGEPLIFYFDRRRQGYDAAARALTHRWWGIDIGDPELYLWGSPVEITKQDRVKKIRDALTNELLVNALELSPGRIPRICERFRRFKPKCVFGYPSTIALFCTMATEQGYDLADSGIQAVFSTADVIYDFQKQIISQFFGDVPVVDSYGSREGGFINHQCPEGNYHVIDPNYILEYIKDNGEHANPGEEGEIVITHLDAWGMPFIRYRTGDMAQPVSGSCPCGRSWSMMTAIRGRSTDFILTPDGRWQHALSLIYVVRDIQGVIEFRILQESLNEVRVLLKIDQKRYSTDGDGKIIRGFKKKMGESVGVEIDHVDEIPIDASGKYRYVISKVAAQSMKA